MSTRKNKNRPANPYTQPIVPQIVKTGEEVKKSELENDKTTERQNEATTLRQDDVSQQQPQVEVRDEPQPEGASHKDENLATGESEQEKATIEVRLYLTQSLDDKLNDLRQEYKRRTKGKRIKPNEIMRKLIEKATIEDLL